MCIDTLSALIAKDPTCLKKPNQAKFDFSIIISSLADSDPNLNLAGVKFFSNFFLDKNVSLADDGTKSIFDSVMPLLLKQCMLKNEDFDKFKRD